ncbi:MAG TPA: hypothetical protein VMA73_12905 [Streptosporangiaceae bacterium]|nr:hypothetical protein [Streptosporangiaceae bacterium]
MANAGLYVRAADCYRHAGLVGEAVRCYRLAGAHRTAGDLNTSLGQYREAAVDYQNSGMPELAAWLLVHHAHDPAAARAVLTPLISVHVHGTENPAAAAEAGLRRRLVLARCAVAEGAALDSVLPVIEAACTELADPTIPRDRFVDEWAVALAEHAQRYDQVALVFAASMRARRPGAAQRWSQWADRVLHTNLILPVVPTAARRGGRD